MAWTTLIFTNSALSPIVGTDPFLARITDGLEKKSLRCIIDTVVTYWNYNIVYFKTL